MSLRTGKRRKLRAITKSKSYHWNQSPLYRLRSKRRLYEILGADKELVSRLSNDASYRMVQVGKNGKDRVAQVPEYELDRLHTRVAGLIRRVATPDYLHSGIKGRSHVTNAQAHLGSWELYTADLSGYFPSVSSKAVSHFFRSTLECSSDVAAILAQLLTYEGHVPTGSRVSMSLAFWCTQPLFDRLQAYANSHGLVMTVYVDDVTFSGPRLPAGIQRRIPHEIAKSGFRCNSAKCRVYRRGESREVTGVVLKENQVYLPRRQHLNIYEGFMKLDKSLSREEYLDQMRKLSGAMASAGQVEPIFRRRASMLNRLKNRGLFL